MTGTNRGRMYRIIRPWLAFWLAVFSGAVPAKNVALLIGINQYTGVRPLEGAVNDVTGLRAVLIERWGFAAEDIVTLTDAQATRAAILNELDRLEARSKAGDFVLFYFSGHGTSGRDADAGLPLPYASGALVPVDYFSTQQETAEAVVSRLIVGRTDLRPRITALDRGGRHVLGLVDACYSGNTLRGMYRGALSAPPLTRRYVPLPVRSTGGPVSASKDPDLCGYNCGTAPEEAYPYRAVAYVSAASESEPAEDIGAIALISKPTYDGRPHGAFTDALLRALRGEGPLVADRDGDGRFDAAELHQVTLSFLRQRQSVHTPQLLPRIDDDLGGIARSVYLQLAHPPLPTSAPDKESGTDNSLRVQLMDRTANLVRALQAVPGLALVDSEPHLVVRRDGGDWQLLSAAGDEIARIPAAGVLNAVAAVRAQVWVRQVLAVAPDSGFRLELELSGQARGTLAVEGQEIHFAVRSARAAQLLVLDVAADGSVGVLYPKNRAELARLPAEQHVRVPADAGDRIVVQAPYGTDQVLAFAFPQAEPRLEKLIGGFWDKGSPALAELGSWLRNPEIARTSLSLVTRPLP